MEKLPEQPLPAFDIPDLNLPALIDIQNNIVNLEDIPDRAVLIMALKAIGFGSRRIGSMLGCTRSTVDDYLKRYDPDGLCTITQEQKRILTTQMFQSTAIASLMEITQEKLRNTNADKLSAIASRCATTAEKLNLSKKIGDEMTASKVDSMMDALDVPIEE